MKSILLTNEGDFQLNEGSFSWIEGDLELAQSVRVLIQTRKGEWFLNEEHGMDRTSILGKNFNANETKSDIIEVVSQEPRIAAIEKIDFVTLNRVLYVDLTLRKDDGTTLTLQEVI